MEKNQFQVIKHENNINKKVFIEVANSNAVLSDRIFIMCNLKPDLQNDIFYYGWDNFTHELLYTCDTQKEAFSKQIECLINYDKDYVYNLPSCKKGFDNKLNAFNAGFLNKPYIPLNNSSNRLIPFDNTLIMGDLTYHCPRALLLTMVEIQFNLNRNNSSYVCIEHILKRYNYKIDVKKKPKLFTDVLDSLYALRNMNMIGFSDDISKVSYTTKIPVVVYSNNWSDTQYTTVNILDCIKAATCTRDVKPENLIAVYLYIRYRMWKNVKKDANKLPEAFFESREKISDTIGLDIRTIDKALKAFTSGENPLLIKAVIPRYNDVEDFSGTYPNAYFVNKVDTNKQIEELKEISKSSSIYNIYNETTGYDNKNPYGYL